MLSKQNVEEYMTIYRNLYGEELPFEDATKQANSLIRLYKAVLPPLGNESSQNSSMDIRNST